MIFNSQTKAQAKRTVTEDEPRKRPPLFYAVSIFAFLMFAYGGYLTQQIFDPDAFPIRRIAVDGEFRQITPEHVQALVSNAIHGGFFDVDVARVRTRILDHPWIFDTSVRRVWPDTIRVSIHEQVAVARWGEYGLLNRHADIFVPNTESPPFDLVVLDGPIGTEAELLTRYITAQERLSEVGLTISHMELSDRRAWVLKISHGATLVVGRNSLDSRLDRFGRAFRRVLKENWTKVESIDLRYTNGFAIREKKTDADNG
ncbi:MAG: cell division protein FtsQ [Gammaproteobacteria bacterium]|jgi:cell division protein FtsQ